MNFKVADRLRTLKPSATLSIAAQAQFLKSQGKPVISLALGEPDFDTPALIKQAAQTAIAEGLTKYTATEGIWALRVAISETFKQNNGLLYDPKTEIIVSSGAKQSIYNLAQVYLNPGDEVLIPSPYWVSYPEIFAISGAQIKIIPSTLEQHYKITAEQLENSITPATKLFVINSPSNPTGVIYSKLELESLAAVLRKHPQILILSDDIYEYLTWPHHSFYNLPMVCPALKDQSILIHGVSKTYAMTGWRIGFAAGPQNLIEAMTALQSQSTSNASSVSQYAALAALSQSKELSASVQSMVHAFKKRHDFLQQALNQLPGITCPPADAGFYLFPQVNTLIKKLQLKNDVELTTHLLEKAYIATVPGSAFGADGHLRVSFATDMGLLKEAISRLEKLLL